MGTLAQYIASLLGREYGADADSVARDAGNALALVSGSTGSNGPAPGTPAWNPAWYALTDIYWDPVAGLDTNSGQVGFPVQSFSEIVRRYGSTSPQLVYGQSLTVHVLSSQPAGVDPVFFEPHVSGGAYVRLLGTPVLVADIPAGGAVTAKSRGAPGTRLQVAAMPAGTVAGQLVLNVTRVSYAFIDSMAVLVATMQQPQATAGLVAVGALPAAVEDDTWTTGDHLQTYTLTLVNLKRWSPLGSDVSAAPVYNTGWLQWIEIPDTSGTGLAVYPWTCRAALNVMSMCKVDTRVHAILEAGRGQGNYALGCTLAGNLTMYGGELQMYGGACGAGGLNVYLGLFNADNDTYLHGTSTVLASANANLGNVFSDGTFTVSGQVRPNNFVWGSYAVTLTPMGSWVNFSNSTFVLKALLTSGALKLGANTTGSTYTGSGVMADGVAITPAAIDAGGAGGAGIFDVRMGNRYCNDA